jgi:UDP-glucose 4-epimerase
VFASEKRQRRCAAGAHCPQTTVAVIGSTGFVGQSIVRYLEANGIGVRRISAPRISWTGPMPVTHAEPITTLPNHVVDELARALRGAQIVINSAGVADVRSSPTRQLFGANSMLPHVVAKAAFKAGVMRYVHISSISVQGNRYLDESEDMEPFSPYSLSRALGEISLLRSPELETTIFRPTSVHGPARSVTKSLVRLAQSTAAAVVGDGSFPTPQVLVEEVAAAVAHVATTKSAVPPIILQPHNGMTTGRLLHLLGCKKPIRIPAIVASSATRLLLTATCKNVRAHSHARRIDMFLNGRSQPIAWLAGDGFEVQLLEDKWKRLSDEASRTR